MSDSPVHRYLHTDILVSPELLCCYKFVEEVSNSDMLFAGAPILSKGLREI